MLGFETLAELGPVLTGERDFVKTSQEIVSSVIDSVAAKEGALFSFAPEPAVLRSVAARGFDPFADPAIIPLTPKHVQALSALSDPENLGAQGLAPSLFFSNSGNVKPEVFRCIVALKVRGTLVGVLALGRREGDAPYGDDERDALGLISHYVSLALHNQVIAQTLEERTSESLKVLTSVHDFYDSALEGFANAIDSKHTAIHGHSLRVGHYAAAIGEAMGFDEPHVAGLRAGGYLHDIGKVSIDKRLFAKPSSLNAEEFREIADHTTVGHRIVSGVHFPWPEMHEMVRSHHERNDGSGYPDNLHAEEVSQPTRIIALADTFDAMITERPYRQPYTVGHALSEIVAATPQKFDPIAVQGLLIQLRREACGSSHFLDDPALCTVGATDIDHLASTLNHRLNAGKVYSA